MRLIKTFLNIYAMVYDVSSTNVFLSPRGEGILHTQVGYKLYTIENHERLF